MPSHNLESSEIEGILRILRRNGQSPTVIRKVAQQYSVTESTISAIGKVITESSTPGKLNTESASTVKTIRESHQQFLAEKLADQVKVAESRGSITEASAQDLEALAAAWYA